MIQFFSIHQQKNRNLKDKSVLNLSYKEMKLGIENFNILSIEKIVFFEFTEKILINILHLLSLFYLKKMKNM